MFTNYPNTIYNLGDGFQLIVDRYFKSDFYYNFLKKNKTYFEEYIISDNETPESISAQKYGDTKYWFLILMINERFDPFYDWVLTNDELKNYAEKYVTENYDEVREYLLQNPEILSNLSETFGLTIDDYTPEIATDSNNILVNYVISHYYTVLVQENNERRKIF